MTRFHAIATMKRWSRTRSSFAVRCMAVLMVSAAQLAFAGVDGDGVADAEDNCPTVWNAEQFDRDGDGIGDVCDNCRFAPNAGQEDSAGFDSDFPDGWGSACQCGDYDDSGRSDFRDVVILRRYLAGVGAEGATSKCPTEAGGVCGAAAVLSMRQALARALPVAPTCQAATCNAVATVCAGGACPENPIAIENRRSGNPRSEWDIVSVAAPNNVASDQSLTGFTTDISYAPGETVGFKVTANVAYDIDIYRIGYYGGMGARRIATRQQSSPVVQICQSLADPADCSNWLVTDSWTIPTDQVTGVYVAKVSPSTGVVSASLGSHILFVIRDDEGASDILFQTADTTWQAYNPYPTADIFDEPATTLYNGAHRVSYDRPLAVNGSARRRTFFGSQYHVIRFLERNGYDVSYFTGVDAARRGSEIAEHAVFLSSGHDEYWSREMRDAVAAARDAGTHLVFLSANLMYWKTRWEDGFRTQVAYKTTQHDAAADDDGFTGTWRDVRFQNPGDLAEPENAVTGLIFGANDFLNTPNGLRRIRVPETDGKMRIWRDTPVASAATCDVVELAPNTIGFEIDTDQDNGYRPPGLVRLSSTSFSNAPVLIGAGTYAAGGDFADEAQATHHAALYRQPGGGLVFNAGTIWWSLGLGTTDFDNIYAGNLDLTATQATSNVLQDMGVVGATPTDSCPSTRVLDTSSPTSEITSHAAISSERIGSAIRLSGTATDMDGVVGGVEVSVDGGAAWHPATGRESWHYDWKPAENGSHTVLSRAVDDSGNLELLADSRTIDVDCAGPTCTIWPAAATPEFAHRTDSPVEVGVRFRSDVPGRIHGIRYWADAVNPGPHTVHLWTSQGYLTAQASSGVSATSGWRSASFASPIAILPNVTYTASFHTASGYAYTRFGLTDARYRQPLRALGGGGVYSYGASPTFPTQVYQDTNYWVDIEFEPTGTASRRIFHAPPSPEFANHFDGTANADPWGIEVGVQFRSAVDGVVRAIRFYRADDSTSQIVNLWRDVADSHPAAFRPYGDIPERNFPPENGMGLILASGKTFAGTGTGWQTVPLAQAVPILAGDTYVASYHTRNRYAVDRNYFAAPVSDPPLIAERGLYRYGKTAFPEATYQNSNYWVDVEFSPTAPDRHSIWPDDAVPSEPHHADGEVEVGVRFTTEIDGVIEGLRFYKHPSNSGTHIGSLWTDTGTELRSATFAGESSCGWQTQLFALPVPVQAGTVYVASYHTTSGYAVDRFQFPVWAPPLRAESVSNGRYIYGPRAFPVNSVESSNYWVDIVFRSVAVPADEGPVDVPYHPLP